MLSCYTSYKQTGFDGWKTGIGEEQNEIGFDGNLGKLRIILNDKRLI